jgi:hypothetical protein
MKRFLIKYQLKNGSEVDWHREIAGFIAALDSDPTLKGRISYRCTKVRGSSDYYHIAEAADDEAIKALQQRPFFIHYTERSKIVSAGTMEVSPLDVIAATAK